MFQNKITIEQYQSIMDQPHVLLDCRFQLGDTEAGRQAFLKNHLPGAQYVHLDEDCSGKITPSSSRHPLPEMKTFLTKVASWGITPDRQVVLYDEQTGAMAARLWWMLRSIGVQNTAILDGGFVHWQKTDLPLTNIEPTVIAADPIQFDAAWPAITTQEMRFFLNDPAYLIVDARAAARYAGMEEPIDPVAGHIPGAINRFHGLNYGPDGLLKSNQILHDEYTQLLGQYDPQHVIFYCGSGVTSCVNILAMEVAGIFGAKLYAGSWSEWIKDPQNPIYTVK